MENAEKQDDKAVQECPKVDDTSERAVCVEGAPAAQGISAVAVLWTFGKCLGALLPVYLAGYYRVSTGLLVCGMMVYTGWKHAREAKEARLRSAIMLLDDDEDGVEAKVSRLKRELPAWVNFPDVEKVEWLNKVLQQVWPFVGQYLEKLLVETIAPSIRASSAHLQTLTFTKVDMGNKAMKVVGIKAHTENDKRQVLLDLYISFVGNVEINVEVKRYFCKAGVKGMQLNGMMRVILEPLIGDVPIVGAVTMFFIQRPKLDINWTGLTNLLDIPGLNVMSDSMIMDAIASFLVLPNRLVVPLVPGLHVAQLRSPLPRGVVRIHLIEAQNLAAKDNYVKGVMAGLSDPYAILRVGPQTFTSKHYDNTDAPKWGEIYEVIVHEVPGQELEVEVYDKDTDQDDFLGRVKLDLGIVKKSIAVDDWFTLKDTPSGKIHFRLEWLKLLPNTDQLEQVLSKNSSVTSKTADPPSSAILVLYLDKAEALPMKKGSKEPNPMVQLSVQDVTRESKTCYTTVNPEWEEAFTFFIQDPRNQDIDIQVKDADRVQSLGSLSIPLSRLLSNSGLSLDQWFQLEKAGPASRVYIHAVLRVLWLDEERISAAEASSKLEEAASKQLPLLTAPHSSFASEGLLRIHLLAGQNLVPKDNLMGGMVKGKSDPYVNINIGGETFTSCVVKSNLNPSWNEMYEVVLSQLPGQELHLEVFDKDMDVKDDFMGRLKINLQDIIKSQYTDQWYTLSDVKSGRVHLVLEWLQTSSHSNHVDQVLDFLSRQSYQNKAIPTAALLFLFIEQADGLPVKKSGKDPKVGAEIRLDKQSRKTTVCDRTTSPKWNEAFCFLVRDPREDILVIKLSHTWTLPIGSLVIPLRELLSEPELVLDQWFHLDGGLPDSQVLLRAQLKMLVPAKCPVPKEATAVKAPADPPAAPKTLETAVKSSSVDPPPVETLLPSVLVTDEEEVKATHVQTEEEEEEEEQVPVVPLPPHTSPDISFASEGMLRIVLLEAQSLVAKDKLMGGMMKGGKSDPYAKITVGQTEFKSSVVKENLSPVWNEMYEVVLRAQPGHEVQVELFDKDMDSDDFLGRITVSLADIISSQFSDQWYNLNEVKSGRVRLILEWVPTVSHHAALDRVLQLRSLHTFTNKALPTAALLYVYVERAHSLPLKKSGKEPRPAVELKLGKTSHKTKVCERSRDPEWKEAVYFLVQNPTEETLMLKVSSAWEQPLCSLLLPLEQLLSEPQLLLDKWMNLDGAPAESQILLRTELKILDSKLTDVPQPSGAEEPEPEFKAVMEDYKPPQPDPAPETEAEEEAEVVHGSAPAAELEEDFEQYSEPAAEEDHVKPVIDSKGGGLQDLVQATVTSLPDEPAEVLPPNTTPQHDFATEGLLRILVLEARSLVAKDNLMGGMVKGKSDPYLNVTVGKSTFKSHVIKENLNPTWNEMYEVVLKADSADQIYVEGFDKDLDSDDFLGRFSVNLKDVIRSQYIDQWFAMNDVKSGRVHLILEWVPATSDPSRLPQILQLQSLQKYQNNTVLSAALLFVHLERAHSLPLKKSGKEPKAGAEIAVGQTAFKTKVCERTSSPEWNESFCFSLKNPKDDMLIVKLSSGWEQPMGSVVVPVRSLVSEDGLVLDQWLPLDGAGPNSQILLRAELKVLDSKLVDLMQSGSLPSPSGNGQIRLSLRHHGKLSVTVHECRELLPQSKDGVDSYVSLMLLPDKSKSTKKKTGVKKKVLDPNFSESFDFDLSLEEARQRRLCASVKNSSSFRGPDVIGQVQINLAEVNLASGVTQWFTLKDEAE
ncbi:unnamed protein product [Knipowitschia caucasica]|uniref:Extended synaptotagmin-1-like n=1 Tax=Knipowitschia caucasica TaxID=637954 RepID=A0AAV2M589_KNICA